MSENIKTDLHQALQRGTNRLQEFNESWARFTRPWNTTARTKFKEILNDMNLSLNEFDSYYKQWQKLIREMDDKEKATAEEQILIQWEDKPEYDDLIYDLSTAVEEVKAFMELKLSGDFQGEVPTNNIPPLITEQGMSLLKDPLSPDTAKTEAVITVCCAETNKINTKYKEKIQVSDAIASKPLLVETMNPMIQKENSDCSTTIIPIISAGRPKKTSKGTQAIEKSNASFITKADCQKIASVPAINENETRYVPSTGSEFQRQNKYDRPPSPNVQQQTPNLDKEPSEKLDQVIPILIRPFSSREIFEHSTLVPEKSSSSGKLEKVKPKIVNQIGPFDPRAVFDHSIVGEKDIPKIECGREWLPAQDEKLVEQFDKQRGPNNLTTPYKLQDVKISYISSSKEIECWKDKPPECNWEANTLTPSTEL